jgi:hypothetical protein
MSVLRNLNVLSQMRLDVPHIRLLESAVAGDFDTIIGRELAGGKGLVVKGFTINGTASVLASTLQLAVADSIAINLNASESGSFIWVPANTPNEVLNGATNDKVVGSFAASSTNYIGLDWVRLPDPATTDLVAFLDPATNEQTSRLVPLGKTLQYRIVISTVPFSAQANLVPIAKVVTNGLNNVTSITDARNMLFRLGSGGDAPNPYNSYSWPQGRYETGFSGGDKSILSQKDWNNAIMTRLWELGGGQNWYSPAADRNVEFTNYGTPFTNGEYFTFDSGTNAVSWQGIRFLFDGGTGLTPPTFNEINPGSGTILDGQVIYVDLDRTQNRVAGVNGLTASIASLANLGTGTMPGNRWVIAWRVGNLLYTRNWRYPVGTTFSPASTTSLGVVKLNQIPADAMQPTVVSLMTGGRIEVTSSVGSNATAATFTGDGTGGGISALGGLGSMWGVRGRGSITPGSAGGRFENLAVASGVGVDAEAGTAGKFVGITNNGIAVSASVNGTNAVGVDVTATGVAGVRVIGGGSGTVGVHSTGGTGTEGGRFVGGNSAGVSQPAGNGVVGVGGGGAEAGEGGHFTGGTGTFEDGDGIRAEGGAGTYGGRGGRFVGTVASSGVAASGAGGAPAYQAITSGNEGGFEYESVKTGVLIIPMIELHLANALTPNSLTRAVGGSPTEAYWATGATGGEVLTGVINVPRGATITGVEMLVHNDSGTNYLGGSMSIRRSLYAGAGSPLTVTSVLNNASLGTIGSGVYNWHAYSGISAQPMPRGRTGISSDSGYYSIMFTPGTPAGVRFYALRVTYTYLEVDFMV